MQVRLLNEIKRTYPILMAGVKDIKIRSLILLSTQTRYRAAIEYKDGMIRNFGFDNVVEFKSECARYEKDLR